MACTLAIGAGLYAGAAPAGVFYVDGANPGCSNAGPGTTTVPYCTISAATTAHNGAGTTILVKPATYRETVTLTGASGAAGNPFTIQATGSAPVLIDGADDFAGAGLWSPFSGSVYLAGSVTWSPVQVFVDGVRLAPSTTAPASMPAQTFQFVSGAGLYVNIGGSNPGLHATFVGRRLYGFRLSGKSYVHIEGFTITRTDDRSIYLSSASNNCEITGNSVSYAASHGIGVTASSGVIVQRNTVSYSGDHGIYLTTGDTGCTVQDNESYGNARPNVRAANGINLNGCSGNVIQRNRLHDNQDTGEQINSSSNNNVSLQNRSWNNGDHGYDHLTSTGTIHIGDVAYHNYKDGFSFEGSSPGAKVWDCIAVDNGLTTNEFNLWVDSSSSSGFQSDYNIFWNSNVSTIIKFISTQYSTIAAFAAATGNDQHFVQADPQWADRSNGDFHLLAGSPAIDSATSSVPNWPSTDAEQHGRVDISGVANTGTGPVPYADRGALEFGACPAEICDGIDNDCDGSVDEGFDVGAPCTVGVGSCAASGVKVCSPGGQSAICNAVPGNPVPEACDNLDNDCDGTIDDGNPGGGAPCGTSDVGECAFGVTDCRSGALACIGNIEPVPEACDGLDNDCDGTIDNGFNLGSPCTSGLGACQTPGSRVCASDTTRSICDASPGEPSPETCDGIDNDCDGTVDDGFDPGTPCAAGVGACSRPGIKVCTGDGSGTTCNAVPGSPAPEVCDGLDNDCDGTIDNDDPGSGAQCGSTDVGECAFGVTDCQGGTLVCLGNVEPAPELCDGLDNDCDGSVDNDAAPRGFNSLGLAPMPGMTLLSWTAPGSTAYDLVRGDLNLLSTTGGDFEAATTVCLADNAESPQYDDPSIPLLEDGFWYLVRGRNDCGVGTYDSGSLSQVRSRDAGINASAGACP